MKLDILTLDNKKSSILELDKSVFEAEVRADILHRMVKWQLAKRRAGSRKTQERSEVTGSRAKIVRQKGSGGARHGNITAPIFVGGGIAHGPRHRGQTRFKKINKKVKNLGLISALSSKVLTKNINIFDEPKLDTFKTKSFNNFLSKLESKSALIIHHDGASEKFIKSMKNIPNTKRIKVVGTNVYDLIKFEKILFTKEAIKTLEERLTK